VLAVRTLSKAFGLAGLRIGYAVGAPELVAEVEKSRGPYKVSALAEEAATLALTEDLPWVREHIAEVLHNRSRFASELGERGFFPLPSDANFLLVPVTNAGEIAARMRAAGVAVRPFTALAGIGDALRISIGPWPLMMEVLDALESASR
jgi:histidinol-phosphate/aromatic aminotransferase/cobyric acid decarboxylase-like protein